MRKLHADEDDRPGLARRDHGPTAHAAASAIEPVSGAQRRAVLRVLTDAGAAGLTDEEMQERLVMDPSSQRPRRVELVNAGLVVDSGRKRQTSARRQATVWTAKVSEKQEDLFSVDKPRWA